MKRKSKKQRLADIRKACQDQIDYMKRELQRKSQMAQQLAKEKTTNTMLRRLIQRTKETEREYAELLGRYQKVVKATGLSPGDVVEDMAEDDPSILMRVKAIEGEWLTEEEKTRYRELNQDRDALALLIHGIDNLPQKDREYWEQVKANYEKEFDEVFQPLEVGRKPLDKSHLKKIRGFEKILDPDIWEDL